MPSLWGREPALTVALIHALIALAIGFGLSITTEQFALIETALAALFGWLTRSQVTPVATP